MFRLRKEGIAAAVLISAFLFAGCEKLKTRAPASAEEVLSSFYLAHRNSDVLSAFSLMSADFTADIEGNTTLPIDRPLYLEMFVSTSGLCSTAYAAQDFSYTFTQTQVSESSASAKVELKWNTGTDYSRKYNTDTFLERDANSNWLINRVSVIYYGN